jgi:hypothetical protein
MGISKLALCAGVAAISVAIGIFLPAQHHEAVSIVELTDTERRATPDDPVATPLKPMEVRITFMDRKDFNATKFGGPEVGGWTDWWSHSFCDIKVATDQGKIYAVPEDGSIKPTWVGEVLAHELLHCLRGGWHPSWNQIRASQAKKWKSRLVVSAYSFTAYTRPDDSFLIESDGSIRCPHTALSEAELLTLSSYTDESYRAIFLAAYRGNCKIRFAPLSTFERP